MVPPGDAGPPWLAVARPRAAPPQRPGVAAVHAPRRLCPRGNKRLLSTRLAPALSLSLASSWSLLAGDTGRRARDRGAGSKTGSLGGEPGRIQMWQDRGRAGQRRRVRPGVQGRPGRQALSGTHVSDSKRSARALWLPGPDRAAFDPGHTGRGCRSGSRTFPPLHLQRGPRPLPPGQQDAQSPPEALASRFQTGQVPIIAREGLTLASATAAPGPRARPQPVAQALGPCDLPTPPSVPSPWPSHPEGPREGT